MARNDRFTYLDLAKIDEKYLIEDGVAGESDGDVSAQYFGSSVAGKNGHAVVIDTKTMIAYTVYGVETKHPEVVSENVLD
jgi:hypothetical protein